MQSKQVSPAAAAALVVIALVLVIGSGYYLFLRPKDDNPVPPGGYKQVSKKDLAAKQAEQMRAYMQTRNHP